MKTPRTGDRVRFVQSIPATFARIVGIRDLGEYVSEYQVEHEENWRNNDQTNCKLVCLKDQWNQYLEVVPDDYFPPFEIVVSSYTGGMELGMDLVIIQCKDELAKVFKQSQVGDVTMKVHFLVLDRYGIKYHRSAARAFENELVSRLDPIVVATRNYYSSLVRDSKGNFGPIDYVFDLELANSSKSYYTVQFTLKGKNIDGKQTSHDIQTLQYVRSIIDGV
jgi:uncharacterized beta-barrel protein YwiB (DUF1934 family)